LKKKKKEKENLGCWHLEILLSKMGNRGKKWAGVRGLDFSMDNGTRVSYCRSHGIHVVPICAEH
jgi:hypothetical protein